MSANPLTDLVRRAISSEPEDRARALEELSRLPSDDLEMLGRLLTKPGKLARDDLLDLIESLGPVAAPASKALARLIVESRFGVAARAAEVALVVGIGETVLLSALLRRLGDLTLFRIDGPPMDHPWAAIWQKAQDHLCRLEHEDVANWRASLADRDPWTLAQIRAYALLVGPALAEDLLEDVVPYLDDESWNVRCEAADLLGRGFGRFAAPYAPRLAELALATHRDHWPLQESCCQALADIGSEGAAEALARLLEAGPLWGRHRVITALGLVGRAATLALPTLRRIASPDSGELGQEYARLAIERIEGRRTPHEDDEVLDLVLAIERGQLDVEVTRPPPSDDGFGTYRTSTGWELDIELRAGGWRKLIEVRSPDGRKSDYGDVRQILCRSAWRIVNFDKRRAVELAGPIA